MPIDKPPFKLVIDLETYHPDALEDTLNRLSELCEEYDQTSGELKTKVTIESWKEELLLAVRDQIETWLRMHKLIISGEATLKGPLVRPKPEPTPMEEALDRLRPKKGDGVDAVEISAGGRTVRLEARHAD